jgi:CRP-like cAMP-binding protein
MFNQYVEVLSNTMLFRGIDSEDLGAMFNCLKPQIHNYNKNAYIAVSGERFNGIGIMLKGQASVIQDNAAGNRIMMLILKQGDMFGEMAAFSSKQEWPANVQSQEACTVMFFDANKLIGSCEKACLWHKAIIQNMLTIISEKALMLNRKVEYLSIKSMRGKISSFLLEQYKKTGKMTFMLAMKRNEMADFLNVSRPSMSRELCRLRDEGIIDFHLSSMRIKDLKALKSSVE